MGLEIRTKLARLIRVRQWWEYKIAPAAGVYYATAMTVDVPVSAIWRSLLTLVVAVSACATYVSIINDLSDRTADRLAGKPDRAGAAMPRWAVTLTALSVGAASAWAWRSDPISVALYTGSWVAFSLYSLPPARLKAHGIAGVLCDAVGANLLPSLLAIRAVQSASGRSIDRWWIVAVGAWSFAYGVRGILFHQVSDREADRTAGIRTFAARHQPRVVEIAGGAVAFPAEMAAAAVMFFMIAPFSAAAALAGYGLVVSIRLARGIMHPVILTPAPLGFMLMEELYGVYLPIAVLAGSALRHPGDWWVLAAHVTVFPLRWHERITNRFRRMSTPSSS